MTTGEGGMYGKMRGERREEGTVTRRRWNERKNVEQGKQRGVELLVFCSHSPKMRKIRSIRRCSPFEDNLASSDMVVLLKVLSAYVFKEGLWDGRRAGLRGNKGGRTKKKKKGRCACLI
jgi:hypothetical protein